MTRFRWTEEQIKFFAMSYEEKLQLFWSQVDQSAGPDTCWIWQGRRNPKGYGVFSLLGQTVAYRVAYRLAKGEIERGTVIRHTCDNPPCCNPAHLLPGTLMDNMRDKWARGRQWRGGPKKKH